MTTPREAIEQFCKLRTIHMAGLSYTVTTVEADPKDILTALAPWLMVWEPIENAPKDGEPVILFSRYEGIVIARWIDQGQRGWIGFADHGDTYDSGENKITVTAPTHFMRLPPKPKDTP